jgi:cell division protein FtsW
MGRREEDIPASLFITCAALLLAVGTLMVYSSSITARPSDEEQIYLSRHLSFLVMAVTAGVVAAELPSRFWRTAAPWLFALSLLLLVAVLIPGVGRVVNGAQRWLRIGHFSFQPSETLKLTLPLLICAVRFRRDSESLRKLPSPRGRGEGGEGTPQHDLVRCEFSDRLSLPDDPDPPAHETFIPPFEATVRPPQLSAAAILFALTGLAVLLIAAEPDFGTAVFVGCIACLAIFLCGWPVRYFLLASLLAVPGLLTLVALKPYQVARLRGFVDTWTQPDLAPYQVRQSLTTLGVGGLEGTGLGAGRQKLSFLPEANTDFIFSVIGEELGLWGTLSVVGLWLGLFLSGRCLIRRPARTSFEAVAAEVLLLQLVLQAAVNVAVVTAMLPPKGIAHPLISYGGSSLVMSVVTVGVILSLTRRTDDAAKG